MFVFAQRDSSNIMAFTRKNSLYAFLVTRTLTLFYGLCMSKEK